jgi:4-diphosphocytidyl-2-C-methyl-D-erythritol kinase
VLRVFAPAKVNLFLRVVGRREDGYHLLDSLAVFADVGDVLTATGGKDLRLSLGGPFGPALEGEGDNLVLRAAARFKAAAGLDGGAHLHLEKHLPVASGIGGGSADAAAALRLLAQLWGTAVPEGLAVGLGADVPVCLRSQPARMAGVGEVLTPAPLLPRFGMVLANPGAEVATPAVFRARAATGAGFSDPARLPGAWDSARAMARDLAALGNDLQEAAVALCPAIGTVLTTLASIPGCHLAQMSGSGATCFALFDTPRAATNAAQGVARCGWWVWGGGVTSAEQ